MDEVLAMRRAFYDALPLAQAAHGQGVCAAYPILCNNTLFDSYYPSEVPNPYRYISLRLQTCEVWPPYRASGSSKADVHAPGVLAVGGHFTIQFDPLPEPFLPSDVARDLSVSTGQQADLLRTLSVSPGSLLAAVMNQTVESCSLAPLPNERKRCVTTLDDMLQFLQLAFGNDQVSVYKTWKDNSHIPGVLETFTVASVRELPCSTSLAPVLCHPRIFPYGVYYCHTITGTRVLEVAMYNEAAPATGDPSVKGIVVCHDDTSNFPVDHISFKVLGLQPGDRICHWHNMHGLVFCDTKDVKSS